MLTLPEANAKFAVDCLHQLIEEHPCDNIVFSPVNLTGAMAMLAFASDSEQAHEIEKILHWDELKECPASRHQRQLGAARSFARSANILKAEDGCPIHKPTTAPVKPRPEPTRPKPKPCPEPAQPEPSCPKPRPHPEPTRPQPTRPKPRPCPEPAQPEPTFPKPRPHPEPTRPQPTRPKPRPCPEPAQPEPTCPKPRPHPVPTRPQPTRPQPKPCPEPAQPEPTCPKPTPSPEAPRTKPRPCPEPAQPEPTCPKPTPSPEAPRPKPRPCPEPAQPPCPEKDVPDYECESPKGVHTEFSKILATLHAPSTKHTLSFANKLYGDHSIAFIQKFIYCALKLYWTDVTGVDIQNAPEEVRRIINLWVDVQTHGKIKDFFPKDSFDCFAQLLFANAVYFKGNWQVKFNKELTVESPFHVHDAKEGDCPKVLLMNRKGVYNTGTLDSCGVEVQAVEIPYEDPELSLIIVLPTDSSPEAFQQLEDSLIHEDVIKLPSQLKPAEVDVSIPKFGCEKRLYAIDYLDMPYLKDPEKADFSQATATEKVSLTELVHAAFIEVDEEGGDEAEAPPCPRDRRPQREPVKFTADHPFLYYVWHNCTQTAIVLGKFAKPE